MNPLPDPLPSYNVVIATVSAHCDPLPVFVEVTGSITLKRKRSNDGNRVTGCIAEDASSEQPKADDIRGMNT